MPWLGLWWLCTCGAWEWKSHAALLTTEVGLLVLGEVVKPSLVLGQHCFMAADGSSCAVRGLTAVDRHSLRFHRAEWAVASDWTQWTGVALPALLLGFEWGFRPLAFLQLQADTWRILEGVGLALCLSQWGKLAYRRPRPALYRAGPPWNSADAWMSFPSGHTTIVAAAWSAYGAHLWKEDVPAWWRWGVLALGSAWTVSTALGRVWGGAHFPTDVMAGAILGVGSGVLGHVIWQ